MWCDSANVLDTTLSYWDGTKFVQNFLYLTFNHFQVYEDVSVGLQRRGYPQECYENTEQLRQPGPGQQPIYPPLSEPGHGTSDLRQTSADNPFRCKSSQSFLRSVDPDPEIPTNPVSSSFKSLLVGPGQGEGPSANLLKKLEDAISIGDHKLVVKY